MNNINITPNAGKLINSLRYLTYTNETAIADIIDNSFDAGADGVNVLIDDKHSKVCLLTYESCSINKNKKTPDQGSLFFE